MNILTCPNPTLIQAINWESNSLTITCQSGKVIEFCPVSFFEYMEISKAITLNEVLMYNPLLIKYFSNDGSFLFAVGCSHFFFVGCKKFIIGYKVILLTVQANCVTKKTPETLEVFPKETFTSLMVVLQSSKSLNLCLDSSRKIM